MTSSSSLYGTPPNQDVSSSNSTSLYGGAATPIPDSSGNVVVRGDLVVLSGNILTTATTGNIFPANATTINLGNAATAINIGASTGTTTVNNDLVVDGDLTINGTFIAPDAEFGNITIAVADDNTITTTTGNLTLTAADNVDIVSNFTSPTRIIRNTPSTNVAVRSLTLAVQSTGTPAAGFGNSLEYEVETAVGNTERAGYVSVNATDVTPGSEDFEMSFGLMTAGAAASSKMLLNNAGDLQIDGDLTVSGNNIKSSSATALTLSGADVAVAGDLTVTGNDIKSSSATALTLSGANVTVAGDLTVTGNDIKASGGTTAVTLSGADVTVAGDLTVTGNDIKASGGTTAVTLSGANVTVAGDLTVTGNDIKGSGGTTALTMNAGSVTVADNLTVTGDTVNLAQSTDFLYSENNNRLNAPVVQSTTGNASRWRVQAPNATASAQAVSAVFNTNDASNGKFINIRADGSAGPLSIRTGEYVANVFGASGNSIDIYDGSTKYASMNPAGPTIGTDLTTKTYVDALTGTTYTIDASSTTGGANFNLQGSDLTTDTIKFANGSNVTVTRTDANTITIAATDTNTTYDFNASSTTGGANLNLVGSDSTTDTVKLSNGTGVTVSQVSGTEVSVAIGQPVATTDAVTFASVSANGVTVGGVANTVSGAPLALASNTAGGGSITATATDSSPGNSTGQLTLNTAALTYTHTDGALVPGVTGTWSFNADGTTNFPSYKFPYADGTANQVLTTDGAGNVTWALPGGGGSTFGNVSIGVDTDQTISTTSGNLILQTAAGVNAGTITLTAGANGDILITPNGTGDVDLVADTVQIGDANATATLTTNGTGNLVLNTNNGTNSGSITVTQGTNADITVAPNGTGKLVVTTETDTNITDGNYILGNIIASRNTSWVPPSSGLSTISSTNGLTVGSGSNYGAQLQVVYYSGDTTAGTNTSAGYVGRGATGTNTAPAAAANNQVLVTFNGDGYATTGFANNIATVNSGGGTTSIVPAQIQLYAREVFADNGTTVTNAGVGFRVRGFPTGVSMSTANRVNYIDHSPNAATYRSDTFTFQQGTTTTSTANLRSNTWNIQNSGGTTTYASFASGGHTIGNIDSITTFNRSSGTTAGTRPVVFLKNSVTTTTTPATGDGASFRLQAAGSNGTAYNLSQVSGVYSATGDSSIAFDVANGDQNTSTMAVVRLLESKLSATTIKATATPTATAGGNTVNDVAIFTPGTTTFKSDAVTLQNFAGTALTSAAVNYTRTFGEFGYTNAAGFAIPAQNTIYTMPLDTTLSNSGVTISGTGNININVSGWYKIIMSLQATLTVTNQPGQFDFWLRKNGADVANSKTQVDLLKDQKAVISMDWLVNSDGNDYWEIVYVGTTTNYADIDFPTIAATTTPYVSPVAPALLVNVIPAGM